MTRFDWVADHYSHQAAIVDSQDQWTYEQLKQQADAISDLIVTDGDSASEPVALLLGNGPRMIAAMLAVLRVGRFYMPLDPASPPARLEAIVEDSASTLLVTDRENLPSALSLRDHMGSLGALIRVVNVEQLPPCAPDADRRPAADPDGFAWLLYTSGSTGKPKGVLQTHRNVLQYVSNYTEGLRIRSTDRYALLFSCAVNAGAHVIYSTLLNGATLCLYDPRRQGLSALPEWLEDRQISLYASVPTLFRNWIQHLTPGRSLPRLRAVMMYGEPVYDRDLTLFRTLQAPGCVFVNRLGSTETGSTLWYFAKQDTPSCGAHVPVGYPVAGNEILLQDDAGEAVPAGEIGEIVVRSRYLSPGYWRLPELTARLFRPDPSGRNVRLFHTGDLGRVLPDGRVVCLGRRDFQIKIRGYRVEPAELESALLKHPGVKEALVLGRVASSGDARLAAYYIPADGSPPTGSELRRWMVPLLPDYMVPSFFVSLAAWPLAPNGKIDRRALPPPGHERPEMDAAFAAPRSALEKEVAAVWQQVLELEPIGVNDPFLELGGTSLLAMRILARLFDRYRVRLPLRWLMEAPTVAMLAKAVSAAITEREEGKGTANQNGVPDDTREAQ